MSRLLCALGLHRWEQHGHLILCMRPGCRGRTWKWADE